MAELTLADLTKDWLERDGDTFLCVRTTGRLEWEKNLAEDAAYSSYLLEAPTLEDLIKRAYPMARNMIVSMDPPYKVVLRISNHGHTSYTDSKVLCVSTHMFDDKELSNGEKLDTFLGTTIHEGCHLLYTDFNVLRRYSLSPNVKAIFNILEDERIEELCGQLKPGLAKFLEKSKYYYFDHAYLDEVEKTASSLDMYHRFLSILLKIIRYPKYLDEEDLMEFADYLFKAKEVLTPYPETTEQTVAAARKIYEIIKEMYIEKAHERSEAKKKITLSASSEEAEALRKLLESTSDEAGDSEGSGDGEKEGEIEITIVDDAEDYSATEEATEDTTETTPESTEDSTDSEETIEPTEEEIAEALSDFEKDAAEETRKLDSFVPDTRERSHLSESEMSMEAKDKRGLLGEECEGLIERGDGKDTFFTKAEQIKTSYEDSYSRVKKFVPAFSRILQGHCREYKLIHRSMRSGVLDTNKLVEAVQGVPTVYIREGEVRTDKVCVVILIDESGSMYGSRMMAAKDTAVLFNEAFSKIPNVELYIYGHTGDEKYCGATEMRIYREGSFAPRYALGSATNRVENRDGVAIYEVAKRVRKLTKTPALMFVLSDGEPSADSYRGSTAIAHTRANVQKAEKFDFQIVQVCINHSYDPAQMFKHFVILEDMSTLAHSLGKVIKKAVMGLAKTRVS